MNKVNSSFWLDQPYDRFNSNRFRSKNTSKDVTDLIELAGIKNAISNFVKIVTKEPIPVKFNKQGDSYTDGKSVVISGSIKKDKDFDIMVGLALHEGSHIKLSDFDILKKLEQLIPNKLKEKAKDKGVKDYLRIVKTLTNYVEDRRIDYFVFTDSPGYREYYRSMYDKYFNDRLITKTLLSNEYTDESIESYMFRIINLHANESSLTKLKGLLDIYREIDLKHISRLKSSEDAFKVALNVFDIILDNIDPSLGGNSQEKNQKGNSPQTGQSGMEGDEKPSDISGSGQSMESSSSTDESNDGGDDETDGDGSSNDETDDSGDETDDGDDGDNNGVHRDESKDLDDEAPELTERQKGLIKKKIKKQERFLDGDVKKSSISASDLKTIEELSESGTEIVNVGKDTENRYGRKTNGIDVIVVKKFTERLLRSSHFPLTNSYHSKNDTPYYQEYIDLGLKKGKILAKKLQVRSEERTTIFNRQKSGRMDKRMISSLGFGNENVFYYKDVDQFNDLNLHMSIDASGSMGGEKWTKTLENMAILIQAVDIIPNLEIQVTMRTTQGNTPYIVKIYDSKEDKIIKVKKLFGRLDSGGTTPEGLTFEAIMDNFVTGTNSRDSYFLNISDGDPYFMGNGVYYTGQSAVNHTKKQVMNIRRKGIKVLSFFVSSAYVSDRIREDFKEMYGSSSSFINISNIKEITRTMNDFFLKK